MAKNRESTRYKSNQQEKRIASHFIDGRQVIGSGSTPFLKGDVVTADLFVEAKTRVQASKSITVKKEWLEKAKEQSYSMRKRDYAVAISFGDGKDYYLIEDFLMEEMYRSRVALEAVIEAIGGLEEPLVEKSTVTAENVRKLIKEALEA